MHDDRFNLFLYFLRQEVTSREWLDLSGSVYPHSSSIGAISNFVVMDSCLFYLSCKTTHPSKHYDVLGVLSFT